MGLCELCGSDYPDGGDSKNIHESLTGVIYERRITFKDDHSGPSIDIDEVISHVKDPFCEGFSLQVDRVASSIATTEAERSHRASLCKRFEELLRRYIQNPIVVQFGSAITGVGTNDSDVVINIHMLPICIAEIQKHWQDLCILFASDEGSLMSEFVRDSAELLSCPAENFRENLIHREELNALSVRDQTEVLFRILKELRREKCGFFKSLHAVSDARCPVIRFRAYDKHLVELSVNNYIGYQKSAYIGAVVQGDQSGTLRKLVLALRFWALSNGLFISEKKKTWNLNSYTITLMFVTFLQSEKLLPVFTSSDVTVNTNDVRVDFAVPSFSLADVDQRKLFKKFFICCVESNLDKLVFSPRKGNLVSLTELQEEMNSKPESVLFVQDPIELTDNVAKNVTTKALKTMRHAMMLSLAAMKRDTDSFAVILRVLNKSETNASPSPVIPNTEGSCRVSGFPEWFDEYVAETLVHIILAAILRCESSVTPAKRPRFDCDAEDLGTFEASKRLWVSRRTLRKKWSALLSSKEQFPLLVEALVSQSLSVTSVNDCPVKFQAFFDVHKDSLWVGLKLIEGDAVDVANVGHFLEQMLTKVKDYFLSDANVSTCHLTVEEFMANVEEIYDHNKERIS
ncbi:hypothetical protein NECAME_04576 [Necator americanus]|uniref:Poly(A) RNA polymerase mitochondrial-like central palm domain-containing protein n=1 Tax=Necator americanus TaxID=51031 RepID=W2ST22_NECAM|nr:hypothetical protein NECAME_04576 [Necator americanus]ETN71832.1 hypothetical protein NECAME_04576 [Necator americanus]